MDTLQKVKKLNADSKSLYGSVPGFNKYVNENSRIDKYGIGFNVDSRFSAFEATITFDTYTGVYGDSSCGRYISLNDSESVANALVLWLNRNKCLVIDGVAQILADEAKSLIDQAREELQKNLDLLQEVDDAN